jgi:hypothetical protein
MIDFRTWLADRSIHCQTLTPELSVALQSQYEAEQQRQEPPVEKLVASADCPARVYRITQPTLFDCSDIYQ